MAILSSVQRSYQQIIAPIQPQTLYIACSGGRDSMALLFACHQLQLPIQVIHINHRIQAISDSWQQLVEQFCQQRHIPFHSVALTWDKPLSSINEQDARQARYQAMLSITGANAIIATAHHANDQVETLLLNLCQGTGINGLVGMNEFSEQQEFGEPVWLWRPLLNVSREQISDFVQTHHLPYVDDPTNTMATIDSGNQRAFLREYVMPLLVTRFDNVIGNMRRTQTNLTEAREIINEQMVQDLAHCQIGEDDDYQQRLSITQLQALSAARRYQLLHHWVKGLQKFAPARQIIEQIDALILSINPEQQAIIGWQGYQVRRYRNTLYRLSPSYVVLLHDSTNFNPLLLKTPKLPPSYPQVLPDSYLPDNYLPDNYQVRRLQANEKLQRWGYRYHEPFKKICQRLGVPSWERPLARVVVDSDTQRDMALLLPSHWLWLAAADEFVIK